jgi:ComF family protein
MTGPDRMHDSTPHRTFPRQSIQSLLALLFPASCPVCQDELRDSISGGICGKCWRAIEPWTSAVCSRCGLPLATRIGLADALCGECRLEHPHFDFARSFGIYAGVLRAAVLQLKFHRRERLGIGLGRLLAEPWRALQAAFAIEETWLILPVPLHRARERERGYNQAAVLARGLAHALRKRTPSADLQLDQRTLMRNYSTAPQSGLSVRARRENVRGVFEVVRPGRLRDRDVILVDDVMTTGATASACAAELKHAGARRVAVLSLGRATPQFPDIAVRRSTG